MKVYVPVSRFFVDYQVAVGRPHSKLEYYLLNSIANNVSTLAELEDAFSIHSRILVEALATLTTEGWIAIDASLTSRFLITASGKRALEGKQDLVSRYTEPKWASVVLERLTGRLISGRELRYIPDFRLTDLQRREGVFLKSEVKTNRLYEGEVEPHLELRDGQWLHWIRFIRESHKENWLELVVSDNGDKVINVPDAWRSSLPDVVLSKLELLGKIKKTAGQVALSAESPPALGLPVNLNREDFLLNNDAHEELLTSVLKTANSRICIVSAFLSETKMNRIRPELMNCLMRGVNVELLWGYQHDAINLAGWLKKLSESTKASGLNGKLTINFQPTESHGKIMIWDEKPNDFVACLGSFNWLSSEGSAAPCSNISVKVKNRRFAARVCRIVDSLRNKNHRKFTERQSSRWKQIALSLEESHRLAKEEESNCQIRIVTDREHEAVFNSLVTSCDREMQVLSHQLGAIASSRLKVFRVLNDKKLDKFLIRYGALSNTSDLEFANEMEELVEKYGGSIQKQNEVHAKVVANENQICISSYNFLSADPFSNAVGMKEIGVLISGDMISKIKF